MEPKKFDLGQSVADYVQLIQSQGSLTGSDVAELSTHLYDATEALMRQQLTQEEAFIIARKRLGNKDILHEEYSKVNTSVNVNKVWAYLFIGLNLLVSLPALGLIALRAIEVGIIVRFLHPSIGVVSITALHIAICFGVIYLVRQKKAIATFFEKQVEKNATYAACWSFIPTVIYMVVRPILIHNNLQEMMFFSSDDFRDSVTEMSFYIMILVIIFGGISLIVSVDKTERLSLRSLFTKPTILFLILTGIVTELMGAVTRIIHFENYVSSIPEIIPSSIMFGLVYLLVSFLIAFYNKHNNTRYLIIFSLLGFILEISVGIAEDIDRGNSYNTAYFASALIAGVLAGKFLGQLLKAKTRDLVSN